MKKSFIDSEARTIINMYLTKTHLENFKLIEKIPPEKDFNDYARDYYLWLLKTYVTDKVDARIQELRPELKQQVAQVLKEIGIPQSEQKEPLTKTIPKNVLDELYEGGPIKGIDY